MIAVSENFEVPATCDRVFCGIPFRWFHQIDAACDAFFARKGITKEPSMREKIERDLEIGLRRKAFRGSRSSQVTGHLSLPQ